MADIGIIPAILIFSFVISVAYSVIFIFRSTDDDFD